MCIRDSEKTVFARDTDPAYIDLLRDIAPDCTLRDGKGLSSLLSSVDGEDKAFALFDVQARASKDAGTGGIWYEHFATAAVIAVDRSRFDGEIKGWRDPVSYTHLDVYKRQVIFYIDQKGPSILPLFREP